MQIRSLSGALVPLFNWIPLWHIIQFNFPGSYILILWPWLYESWIYNYLCNYCLSPLMLWVRISIRARCTTLCDKVCQWLATDRWFSPGPPISSTNKTDCHDITKILLKMALHHQATYVFEKTCFLIYISFLFSGSNVQIPSEVVILNSIVLPDKALSGSYKNQIIL
jgi:hypothetical protein